MKKKWKSVVVSAAIILAVIALPLCYSLFYLGAFWDPYGKLTDLPIAVVNEDQGATVNSEQRNLGEEMEARMKEDGSLKYVFTDAQTASNGLNGDDYYAVITIPKDFSTNIASAETKDKQAAKIQYSANEKRNFLAAQILNRAVLELEEQTRSTVNQELTDTLLGKLKEVPASLQELSSGLGEIQSGAGDLSAGAVRLSDGENTLASGIFSLNSGLKQLEQGSSSLSGGLFTLHQGISQTKKGVDSALVGLTGSTAQQSSLTEGVQQLKDGAGTLSKGLASASAGAAALSTAASSQTTGLPAFSAGIDALDAGANSLSSGVGTYVDGVNSLISQNQKLGSNLAAIYASTTMSDAQKVAAVGQLLAAMNTKEAQAQMQALNTAGTALKTGAAKTASGADALKASEPALTSVQTNLSAISNGLSSLSSGASALDAGIGQLQQKAAGLQTLSTGLQDLSHALDKLDSGSMQLYDGAKTMTVSLGTAKDGSNRLAAGVKDLQDGAAALKDGAAALQGGVVTAKAGVDKASLTANNDLAAADGLPAYAADPVDVEEAPINAVPNYGTAFAPYFLSLSLFVGAIIMFVGIYLDGDEKIPVLARSSNRKLVRVGVFALIGVAQAVLLALLVKYGLGLTVRNPAAYFFACILTSLVFISIVEFFMVCLGDIGKFLSLLLLILQLTSCGGTFPMELVPKFFSVLYPFMPMTYSVQLFRESISGYDGAAYGKALLVLVCISAAFTLLTILFSAGKKAKMKRLENSTAAAVAGND